MTAKVQVVEEISQPEGALTALTFRDERFIDKHPDKISLIKIGEYVRTPLFEPSIRSMRLTLSDVRKQLLLDRRTNGKFNRAWKAATKIYQVRSAYFKEKFQGPEEYCIALVCYTLDEPYKVYEDFNRMCQQLMTDTWMDFPYKSFLYLLIQAEMRMTSFEETVKGSNGGKLIKRPITITTGLDYKVEEEKEDVEGEPKNPSNDEDITINSPVIHTSTAQMKRPTYCVYRGLNFAVDDKEFQPRTLVAFSHLMSATIDEARFIKYLSNPDGGKKTILQIDQVSWSSRYIGSLSVFPVEKEVLIWPWVKFYVEERKMIGNNIEKILLKPTSRSFMGNNEIQMLS